MTDISASPQPLGASATPTTASSTPSPAISAIPAREKFGAERDTPDPNAPPIRVVNLDKHFGDLHVLKSINLTVERGEVVCVIGPSGSGKSTLLRSINLLEQPSGGKVYVEGIDLTDPDVNLDLVRTRIGMVFQQFNLFPHFSVLRNVTIAQEKVLHRPRRTAEQVAKQMLERVGLSDKLHAHPS
ncbi:MAG: ATP-binding cassette domain-containing protein, partial [Propionibacteriaceae bacterium]|nr:ATP-binding cassette domain-containing protein [Propionibacteriaceae bacterium]